MLQSEHVNQLDVYLHKQLVGVISKLNGERLIFTFDDGYIENKNRPVLSQSYLDGQGQLTAQQKITQTKLSTYFSNLLPEGYFREYIASKYNIHPEREFLLAQLLGEDLPGAVVIKPSQFESTRLDMDSKLEALESQIQEDDFQYHFSLAGVQLKFSALYSRKDGLRVPAYGVGGDWIIKLPSERFDQVPENEFTMMQLAKKIGMEVPDIKLIENSEIKNLPEQFYAKNKHEKIFAIRRFDRSEKNIRIHTEDFAQVYGVYPARKYERVSYNNIANLVYRLIGSDALGEFVRRLVFNLFIGNADMHLKNWSLLYKNPIQPVLAPAYDFVSTIVYLPDDKMALSLSGEKNMQKISLEHFEKMADKANLPKTMVKKVVKDTVEKIQQAWPEFKKNSVLTNSVINQIDAHQKQLILFSKNK